MVDGRHAISKGTSFPEKSNMAFATEKHTVKRRNSTKDLSISELNDLMNQVFPLVQTNLSKLEITELLMLAPKCRGASIQQITIPIKDSYGGMTGLGGRSLFSVDFDTNAQALREFMYGENSDS